MARIAIPVLCLEFEEGGSTIWLTGPSGGTVLRVKVKGKLSTTYCKSNLCSHLDLMASDVDPVFCLGPEVSEEGFDNHPSDELENYQETE